MFNKFMNLFSSKQTDTRNQEASFANRLLQLEVNIVLKDAMTALPMKMEPRQVLMDIARNYRTSLEGMGIDMQKEYSCFMNVRTESELHSKDSHLQKGTKIFLKTDEGITEGLEQTHEDIPTGSYASFDRLREIADSEIKILKIKLAKTENEDSQKELNKKIVSLTRIRDMSDHIKEIFKSLQKRYESNGKRDSYDFRNIFNEYGRQEVSDLSVPPLKLYGHEINLLRKIWDLGNEVILMQSIITLDGDVITRVSPDVLGDEYRYLYDIHNAAVKTSISYWKILIGLVKDVVKFFTDTGLSLLGWG